MSHTITVHLTDAAQRAALLDGQPAQAEQTYEVPQDLLSRLLELPWTLISDDGHAQCTVPPMIWFSESTVKEPPGTAWNLKAHGCFGRFDVKATARPVDAAAAIDYARHVIAHSTASLDEKRRTHQAEQADHERRTRAKVEAWASLPVEWRATRGGVAFCKPHNNEDSAYRGQLSTSGYRIVDRADVGRLAPDALAEAEAEVGRLRGLHQAELARRVGVTREAERRLLAEHGTESQRERWEAGCLPEDEIRALAHAVILAPIESFTPRDRLEIDHGHDCYRDDPETTLERQDDPDLSDLQWKAAKAIRAAVERIQNGSVKIQGITLSCDECEASTSDVIARVTVEWAGRTLSRELALVL